VPYLIASPSVALSCGVTEEGYPTPEAAALAEWADLPQAEARLISVKYQGTTRAVVVTDTWPSHPLWNYVTRTADGWIFNHDHNGPPARSR
jgi:hypothetical protein